MDKRLVLEQALKLHKFYQNDKNWAHGSVYDSCTGAVCLLGGVGVICNVLGMRHDEKLQRALTLHSIPTENEIVQVDASRGLAKELTNTIILDRESHLRAMWPNWDVYTWACQVSMAIPYINDVFGYGEVMSVIERTIARLCKEVGGPDAQGGDNSTAGVGVLPTTGGDVLSTTNVDAGSSS